MIYNRPGHERDNSLILITLSVILGHLSLFILSAFLPDPKPIPPPTRQLIVKTINFQEERRQKPITSPAPAEVLIAENDPIQEISVSQPVEVQPILEEKIPEPAPVKEKEILKEVPKETPKPKPTPPKKEKKKEVTKPKKTEKKAAEKKKIKETPKAKEKPKPKEKTPKKAVNKTEPEKPKNKILTKPKPPKPTVDPEVEAQKVKQAKQAEEIRAKKRELLANAEKSIAQIEQTRDKLSSTSAKSSFNSSLPSKIDALQVETFPNEDEGKLSPQEMSYYDELASRLKLLLRLPEFGEVKIKLTLERSGKFVKVSVVNAQSSTNKKYVESKLPTLTYPAFGDYFDAATQYTFVIALSNE